jgi:hypothetical protein
MRSSGGENAVLLAKTVSYQNETQRKTRAPLEIAHLGRSEDLLISMADS